MNKINYKTKWDLSQYYNSIDDPKIEEDINHANKLVDEFIDKYKEKIRDFSEEDFIEYFKSEDEMDHKIETIGYYYFYLNSLNTQDQKVKKKEGEFDNILVERFDQFSTDNSLELQVHSLSEAAGYRYDYLSLKFL